MLYYYLKNALRQIKNHRAFSIINILGLSLGLSSCLLIILYTNFELTFDKFHENGSNIYRVVMHQPGNKVMGSSSDWWVVSPAILKPTWEDDLPEIDLVTRTMDRRCIFRNGDQYMQESINIVDPEFLDIFSFPLMSGNKTEVLKDLYSIIISEKICKKYFGDDDPIGKTMILNDGKQFVVSGVLKEIPKNSQLQFDLLVSFKTYESMVGRSLLSSNWLNNSYTTYLTLHRNTNLELLDKKLFKYDVDGFNGKKWSFHLQPLYDVHFNRQISGTGDKGTIYIFTTVGLFILLIACFNYMNLYIAHYRERIKSISLQKVLGASQNLLIQQFLTQSILFAFISYLLSIIVVWLVLPWFNVLMDQDLSLNMLWQKQILITSLGLIVIMAILSGTYPAIYISRLKTLNAIKGGMEKFSKGNQYLRKLVVTIQFSVSILLVVGTITVFKQVKFTGNKSLGHQKENIIYIRTPWDVNISKNNINTFKQILSTNPNILGTAASTGIPSNIGWSNIPKWEGQQEDDNPFFYRIIVDYDFLDFYGIQIEEGRTFLKEMGSDEGNAYILNKPAIERIQIKNPIGARFGFDQKLGTIIGVTKDFHFETLHKPITPLGIGVSDNHRFNYLSVKINSTDSQRTLEFIEQTWVDLVPDAPINYSFLDERLEQLYAKDQQLAQSLNYFSLLALFISCLGIFGLISFSLGEKTKEIGIRKVLGASFISLLRLLTKEVVYILGGASIIGGAAGWYFSSKWLNNFAYRFEMGFDIIFISSILTLIVTFVPLSFKLVKSVRTNVIHSLRKE